MPRPKRVRIVSCHPRCLKFKSDVKSSKQTTLTFEEYEAIRLMDYKRLTHDEAATMMNISRTTVTEIYDQARKKVAEALIEGNDLIIEGGNYEIITHNERLSNVINMKEEKNMMLKVAVTYDNGEVFQHFGKTENFKIFTIENKKILKEEVVNTNGQGHGALAVFLLNQQVHLLICGGIGGGAINALSQAGIKILPGVSGNVDQVINAYLNETLQYNADYQCDHHGEHEHKGCNCGDAHHEHHHDGGCGCGCHDK